MQDSSLIVLQSYVVKLFEGKYWKEKQPLKSKRSWKSRFFGLALSDWCLLNQKRKV